MNSRFFWEKSTLKRYRVTFETAEIVIGATRRNKYKTFRKDTGVIAFSRRELLEVELSRLRQRAERIEKRIGVKRVRRPALKLGFDHA
jgi:hypothetical protein